MNAWRAAKRLAAAGLLTPRGLTHLALTAASTGGNLAALARFAARRVGADTPALIEPGRRLSYGDLAEQTERLASHLRTTHGVERGAPIGVLGRNGIDFVLALFAASRLGARVLLLNPEMPPEQLAALIARHRVAVVLTADGAPALQAVGVAVIPVSALAAAVPADSLPNPRVNGGQIVVLTGGTTGPPKAAARQASPASFIRLFAHLTEALGLDRHQRAYVAVPLFHGYGVAAFIFAVALGRTVYLTPRFDASTAAALIARERIEVVALVPLMLQRLLAVRHADLSALRVVITGGAALPPTLAEATRRRLGDLLFNLYGTSEAGVCIFATPQDLRNAPGAIGRPIWGVRAAMLGDGDREAEPGALGRLAIHSSAAALSGNPWVETGDLATCAADGLITLHGRADEMISSGGEKVHPWEIETVLLQHPDIREAAAIGVPDPEFGQRLVGFVVLQYGAAATPDQLQHWLRARVARYQRPRAIELRDSLPITAVGKLNKRALRAEWETRNPA